MREQEQKYQPTPEEIKKAEDMMSPTQRSMSEKKEFFDRKRGEILERYNSVKGEIGLNGDVTQLSFETSGFYSNGPVKVEHTIIRAEPDGHEIVVEESSYVPNDGMHRKEYVYSITLDNQPLAKSQMNVDFDEYTKVAKGLFDKLLPLAELRKQIDELDRQQEMESLRARQGVEDVAHDYHSRYLRDDPEIYRRWNIAKSLFEKYTSEVNKKGQSKDQQNRL